MVFFICLWNGGFSLCFGFLCGWFNCHHTQCTTILHSGHHTNTRLYLYKNVATAAHNCVTSVSGAYAMPIIFWATLRYTNIQNTALEHVNKRCSISTSPLSDPMKEQKIRMIRQKVREWYLCKPPVCWLCIVYAVCVCVKIILKIKQRETQGRDNIEQRNIDKHFPLVHEIFIWFYLCINTQFTFERVQFPARLLLSTVYSICCAF